MFSPLKNSDAPRRILHQGKFYDLGENHKVVFACNPVEYGGGRFEQKLFSDGKIPAFYLRDFPASYIYEKILKEEIYDKLAEEIRGEIPEEEFKEKCQGLIKKYQESNSPKNSAESNEETVRELQEKVLCFIDEKYFAQEFNEIATDNFISTSATSEVEKALASSIRIRKNQRNGHFPAKSCGLNGVILEGDSGIGKSVLIEAVLRSEGLEEINLGDENAESCYGYYKIDANLPLEQKRQIITKAFEQGKVVWIDEINSCIDDGLEKILNGALTGDHPDGKKLTPNPGFTLISSVNSAGIEGRSLLSPALKHRTIQPRVPSLEEYSPKDFEKIVNHWMGEQGEEQGGEEVRKEIVKNVAQIFWQKIHQKPQEINLRILRKKLPEILTILGQETLSADSKAELTAEELAKLAQQQNQNESAKDGEQRQVELVKDNSRSGGSEDTETTTIQDPPGSNCLPSGCLPFSFLGRIFGGNGNRKR